MRVNKSNKFIIPIDMWDETIFNNQCYYYYVSWRSASDGVREFVGADCYLYPPDWLGLLPWMRSFGGCQCTKVYKVDGKRMPKSSFLLDLYHFMYFFINVDHILVVEGVKLPKKSFQKTSLWQNFQIWVDSCTENGYFQSAFSAWCRKMPWYRLLPTYLLETLVFRKNSLVYRVVQV